MKTSLLFMTYSLSDELFILNSSISGTNYYRLQEKISFLADEETSNKIFSLLKVIILKIVGRKSNATEGNEVLGIRKQCNKCICSFHNIFLTFIKENLIYDFLPCLQIRIFFLVLTLFQNRCHLGHIYWLISDSERKRLFLSVRVHRVNIN